MVEEVGGRVTTQTEAVDLGAARRRVQRKIHDEMLATLTEVRRQAPSG
jgi:hypothetical protein